MHARAGRVQHVDHDQSELRPPPPPWHGPAGSGGSQAGGREGEEGGGDLKDEREYLEGEPRDIAEVVGVVGLEALAGHR